MRERTDKGRRGGATLEASTSVPELAGFTVQQSQIAKWGTRWGRAHPRHEAALWSFMAGPSELAWGVFAAPLLLQRL